MGAAEDRTTRADALLVDSAGSHARSSAGSVTGARRGPVRGATALEAQGRAAFVGLQVAVMRSSFGAGVVVEVLLEGIQPALHSRRYGASRRRARPGGAGARDAPLGTGCTDEPGSRSTRRCLRPTALVPSAPTAGSPSAAARGAGRGPAPGRLGEAEARSTASSLNMPYRRTRQGIPGQPSSPGAWVAVALERHEGMSSGGSGGFASDRNIGVAMATPNHLSRQQSNIRPPHSRAIMA